MPFAIAIIFIILAITDYYLLSYIGHFQLANYIRHRPLPLRNYNIFTILI